MYLQEVEKMKAQVKELTEDNQSQVKINTSLQSQLNVASDYKNAMQERINLLEKKLQKATSLSSNNESSKTISGDDIVEPKSSKGDEGSVDVKTNASKADTDSSSSTLAKVPLADTTQRSPLSNVGNRQSINSANGTTTKQKKATDLKSQASTTNNSKRASVSRQSQLPDENSTVTCPAATSELCSDHFTKERNEVQNETSDSTLDKQVPPSSSCKSNNLNQGSGGESRVIHPRRQKRQSLEEFVQSLGNNTNHQAKAKEGGVKSDDKKQDKAKGNADKKELVKETTGKAEPNNPGKSLEDLNKTSIKKTEDDIPELDVQGKRKRKSVDLYIPERIRPKKKKPVESAIDSTENKENIDDEGIEVGDVGYAFKKYFSAPYNDWYDVSSFYIFVLSVIEQ